MHGEYKMPGGKLVVVDLEVRRKGDTIIPHASRGRIDACGAWEKA